MIRPLRVAIAGYGTAGELHARLLATRPRVRVVGVADITRARRARASADHPGAAVASGLDRLETGIDLIVVATPPVSHEGDTYVALTRHRAHVLCEKPAVLDPDRGRRLAELASRSGLSLHPVHNYLHAADFRRMRELIGSGVVGRVRKVTVGVTRTAPAAGTGAWMPAWRADPAFAGGVLHDHGPHAVYLACHLSGGPVARVSCATVAGERGADRTASLRLDIAGGVTARIGLTWAGGRRSNRYQVDGTGGSLLLQGGRLRLVAAGRTRVWPAEDPASGGHVHAHWTDALHSEFLARLGAPESGPWSAAIHVADVLRAAAVSVRNGGDAVPLSRVSSPGRRRGGRGAPGAAHPWRI
ncbi:Gfo/Idh/MocA family protein [Streptomyces specialis]|uniref:Gfo/Idh/MocA family protein n=1 Tax=Streptomyces specialis TaxID=498367 RepID=UPI00099EF50E